MRQRTDEVPILEVEAVQFVAGGLRIHDILVDDKSGPLCVVGDTLSDLAAAISIAVSEDSVEGA